MSDKTIWRYNFQVDDTVTLPDVPFGADFLPTAQRFMAGAVSVWAVVEPDAPVGPRTFHVRGTGHPLDDVGRYLGTVMDGILVWHVFEAKR